MIPAHIYTLTHFSCSLLNNALYFYSILVLLVSPLLFMISPLFFPLDRFISSFRSFIFPLFFLLLPSTYYLSNFFLFRVLKFSLKLTQIYILIYILISILIYILLCILIHILISIIIYFINRIICLKFFFLFQFNFQRQPISF